jgi:cell division transport system permease protein
MSSLAAQVDALQGTARILARHPGRFFLGLLLCASAFSLPLILALLVAKAAPAWRSVNSGPEISIFLRIGTPSRELDALRSRLSGGEGVIDVRVIPREQAYSELRKRSGLDVSPNELRSNPLPDALVVRFALTVDPAVVDRTAAAARKWTGVEAVQADIDWFRRLVVLKRTALAVAAKVGVLAAALVAVGLVVGAQAAVHVRRDEVELLRLVGAEDWLVRRPYAYVGFLSAAGGAALAIALVAVAHTAIDAPWTVAMQALQLPTDGVVLPNGLAPVLVFVAGLLGALVAELAARLQLRGLEAM